MNQIIFYWLMSALLLVIFELGHPGLFLFFSFSIGALGGATAAYAGLSIASQCAIALVIATVTFFVMGIWVRRKFSRHQERHKTNVDALVGKKGVVTVAIESHASGQVKVAGQIWSARSIRSQAFVQNEQIIVVEVRGSHLIVDSIIH